MPPIRHVMKQWDSTKEETIATITGTMSILKRIIFIETDNEFYSGSYQITILYILNPLEDTIATFGDFQLKVGSTTHFYEMS
jgi:hypothetical protein